MSNKIQSVEFEKLPIFAGMHLHKVNVITEGAKVKETIFSYYPDEISFTEEELIGLTIAEAHALNIKKDVEYLQS